MVAVGQQRKTTDMQLKRNTKNLILLVMALLLSFAYLVRAFKKVGIAGVVVFLIIWAAVFCIRVITPRISDVKLGLGG
jgi:hypothetical protein